MRDLHPKVKEIYKDKNKNMYSFSKLSTYENCKYAYYKSYIEKDRGEGNIYTELGSVVHDILEEAYNNKEFCSEKAINKLNEALESAELLGYNFGQYESTKFNFIKSIEHFFIGFSLDKFKSKQEGLLLDEVLPNKFIMGFYDQIRVLDNNFDVIDFKTSTKFKKSDRFKKAIQLLLYAYVLNKNNKKKVDRVAWLMLKYVEVWYNGKRKISLRSEIVKDNENKIRKELEQLNKSEFEIDMLVEEAFSTNIIPNEVKDKFELKDWYDYYEFTEEDLNKAINWVKNTIIEIENNTDWSPNTENSYYCNTLCNHRKTCKYIKEKNNDFTMSLDDDLF